MQKYPVRPSHRRNLSPAGLTPILGGHFESVGTDADAVIGKFGAISRISVKGEGRELVVEMTMDPKVPEEVARETIRRYNQFLQDATGYSAKERAKRLKKAPAAGTPGE